MTCIINIFNYSDAFSGWFQLMLKQKQKISRYSIKGVGNLWLTDMIYSNAAHVKEKN